MKVNQLQIKSVACFLLHGNGSLVECNRVEHVLGRGVRALRDWLGNTALVQVMADLSCSRRASYVTRLHLVS